MTKIMSRLPSSALCFQVTTLGKLFTFVPLSPTGINWYWPRSGENLWLGPGRCALAYINITNVTCMLPAYKPEISTGLYSPHGPRD